MSWVVINFWCLWNHFYARNLLCLAIMRHPLSVRRLSDGSNQINILHWQRSSVSVFVARVKCGIVNLDTLFIIGVHDIHNLLINVLYPPINLIKLVLVCDSLYFFTALYYNGLTLLSRLLLGKDITLQIIRLLFDN